MTTLSLFILMSSLSGNVEVTSSSEPVAPWWKDNSIINLFNGSTLDKETLEGAVGTLSIVCGLILTVPYSVMSNMSVGNCNEVPYMNPISPTFIFFTYLTNFPKQRFGTTSTQQL